MDFDNIPSIVDENEVFNISEVEDTKPFYKLSTFVNELAPSYVQIMGKILKGEDVRAKDVHHITLTLTHVLVPYYNRDGSISDPRMAQLHETLNEVGRQL